jgi:hypothetical protein
MRIISQAAPVTAPSEAAAMQALKKELEQLKAEVAALRVVNPLAPRRSPDPLFAQLWTYIKTDK